MIAEGFRDLGDRVLVLCRTEGRGRGSGVPVNAREAMVCDFRDGKSRVSATIMIRERRCGRLACQSRERLRAGLASVPRPRSARARLVLQLGLDRWSSRVQVVLPRRAPKPARRRPMSNYAYDQAWQEERERLQGLSGCGTRHVRVTRALGVGAGSRVAEVGAGGGSVVEWLSKRVGESGRVFAADSTWSFSSRSRRSRRDQQHDIIAAPLPAGEFTSSACAFADRAPFNERAAQSARGGAPGRAAGNRGLRHGLAGRLPAQGPTQPEQRRAGVRRARRPDASAGHDGECGRNCRANSRRWG